MAVGGLPPPGPEHLEPAAAVGELDEADPFPGALDRAIDDAHAASARGAPPRPFPAERQGSEDGPAERAQEDRDAERPG